MEYVIEASNLSKTFSGRGSPAAALNDVSFKLPKGESMAIIGPSGSGKTTLLHLLGGLDKPNKGKLLVAGRNLSQLSDKDITRFRNQSIGFVFQFFYLHDYLTAAENIALPLWLAGKSGETVNRKVAQLLNRVGMQERADFYPRQLSGGEMQRVAVARALAKDPQIILADEPTGNLDQDNAHVVLALFDEIAATGVSIVVITHDKHVSDHFQNQLHLNKGKLYKD